ncbi:MAG: CRISPR-associated endonuclease Cas2 [Gemmataceae bacterium]|nr:CRISPR-associated endonuclease Cas2 [Gemmataceae bacterium]MDW8244593.1 CRISPR-associated endonuclease Cas2 [Thermogemmata sp.]
MAQAKWWIICYDVRDPKRLRKCAKHMEGYGIRLQKSVFRCWLTPTDVQRLRWELTVLLDPQDSVLFFPLCGNCLEGVMGIHNQGRPKDWIDKPPTHLIV